MGSGPAAAAPAAPEDLQAPTPGKESPEVREAVDQQRRRLRAARGRRSTILTAGNQLGEPDVQRKTILGG
jgi:hypothetical protein